MRRYGATADAERAAREWVTVEQNFAREGTIREKYNVETQSSETIVTAGYKVQDRSVMIDFEEEVLDHSLRRRAAARER